MRIPANVKREVREALEKLRDEGEITIDEFDKIRMTEKGRSHAQELRDKVLGIITKEGEAIYEGYEDVSQEEAIKILDKITQEGHLGFIKWTCEKCGERVTNTEPNVFNTGGYKHTEKADGTECGYVSFPKRFGIVAITESGDFNITQGIKEYPNCILCGKPYKGMGNNPLPLADDGRCCDDCNQKRVLPARLNQRDKYRDITADNFLKLSKKDKIDYLENHVDKMIENGEWTWEDDHLAPTEKGWARWEEMKRDENLKELIATVESNIKKRGVRKLPSGEVELSTELPEETVRKLNAKVKELGVTQDEFMQDLIKKELAQKTREITTVSANTEESFFKGLGIPEIDRLKHFQLVKKYWAIKMGNTHVEEDFISGAYFSYLRALWKTSFKASMEEAKVFAVPEDIVPSLLHSDSADANLPFPSIFLDVKVKLKNRTYYGFHVGSYYTDKAKYRAILSVYSKEVEHRGQMVRILIPDFIMLKKTGEDDVLDEAFKEGDYYHNQVRKFVFAFCHFVNEPEVTISNIPVNPNNNKRRIDRGVMPLPEFKVITVRGKLKIHIDRVNYAVQHGTRMPPRYKFKVKGFYRHFYNKKRYAKLYALSEEDKERAGLKWCEKHKGVLHLWIKDSVRGEGKPIRQIWEVKK